MGLLARKRVPFKSASPAMKNKIIQGDCLEVLKTLDDESVDCVVTSPPYWALRDYGVAGQLGLEPTFQEYISKLCDIFDEVKRVLKKEGTCWVNMGDTFSGGVNNNDGKKVDGAKAIKAINVPDKCLLQIPSRFAIEMTNRGWILRNEIIWHKPNCMPSSVKDRFTVDFEKVFFFVKSKKYWFETQYEPHTTPVGKPRDKNSEKYESFEGQFSKGKRTFYGAQGRNKRCVWKVTTKPFKEAHFATYPEDLIEPMIKAGCPENGIVLDPFFGAGTTGLVAKKQNKNYIGIELNTDYIKIAEARLQAVPNKLF